MNFDNKTDDACFKVQYRMYRPFMFPYDPVTKTNRGLVVNILEVFSKHYNICYTLDLMSGIPYGRYFPKEDTFNGNLGLLLNGTYDLFTSPLYLSSERYRHFDFTDTIDVAPMTVVYEYPKLGPDYTGFVKPFTYEVWFTLAILLILTSVILFAVFFFQSVFDESRSTGPSTSSLSAKSSINVIRIFLGQALDDAVMERGKLYFGVFLLASFVINVSYKCNLKAALIIPKINVPFNTFDEMVAQHEVKWRLIKGTVFSRVAQNAPPGTMLRKLSDGMMEPSIDGEADYHNIVAGEYAYISNKFANLGYIIMGVEKTGTCNIALMEGTYWSRPLFLLLRKKNPFAYRWNKMFRRLTEHGIMQQWYNTLSAKALRCVRNTGKVDLSLNRPLLLQDFYGIFGVLVVGLFLSLLIFICEVLLHKIEQRNNK